MKRYGAEECVALLCFAGMVAIYVVMIAGWVAA